MLWVVMAIFHSLAVFGIVQVGLLNGERVCEFCLCVLSRPCVWVVPVCSLSPFLLAHTRTCLCAYLLPVPPDLPLASGYTGGLWFHGNLIYTVSGYRGNANARLRYSAWLMTVDEVTFLWNLRIKTIIVLSHGGLLYRWSVYKGYTLCVTDLM